MHDDRPVPSRGLPPIDAALLLLAAAIYGGIFPINRLAAEMQWPPVGFAFAQSLAAGVILALAAVAAGGRFAVTIGQMRTYLIMGGLVVGLPIGILVSAAPHVDASVLTLVLCLSPILPSPSARWRALIASIGALSPA
ncbi:EamA family transporter [Mesorhizobium sp. B2-8-3]|uniref:EamA family transporter n=1 Tax=Mesorhizobium sp. B2-8-3 TaxID=2589905 RepID=UPI0015E37DF9|nr:EamA family transporter [Mesorhizobium sp. B2-8-3]